MDLIEYYDKLEKSGEIELSAIKIIEEKGYNKRVITVSELFDYLCKINKYTIPYLFNFIEYIENITIKSTNFAIPIIVVIKCIYRTRKIKSQSSILNIISDDNLRLNILKGNDIKSLLLIGQILNYYIHNDSNSRKEIYISSNLDNNGSIYISYKNCPNIKTNKYLCDNINIYICYFKKENLFGIGLFYFPDPINNPIKKEYIFSKRLECINLISNKNMSIYSSSFIDNSFIISDYIEGYFI